MSESEFWEELRFRLNYVSRHELCLFGWCDWFTPKKYVFDGLSSRIMGRVGFVLGRDVVEREFTLFLNQAVRTSTEIEWATLLPPVESNGWLSFDSFHNRIDIDPAGACDLGR